jgi:N-acetylmuramic acid 6-phosphate etherase
MMADVPPTEGRSTRSSGLDRLDTAHLVELLIDDQHDAITAVAAQQTTIARVVDAVADRLSRGGRLHYVGAGSSGRLGVLDASEMPPTFGTAPDMVCAHIAGGDDALRSAIEGAEDDGAQGDALVRGHVSALDAVIGISASGGAAFVTAAIERARLIGAYTAAITSSADSHVARAAQDAIVAATGAEILSGSTRLKAGTAQKVALNTISTAVMIRLGKVYDNLMIDVVAKNDKLRGRALRLVRELTGAAEAPARDALTASGWSVKAAVVMLDRGIDADGAHALLSAHEGRLADLLLE